MSDTKSPLYALSKDTTNSLNSMLDNKHAHVLDTSYFFSPLINLWTNSRSAPAYRNFWPEKLSFIGGGGGGLNRIIFKKIFTDLSIINLSINKLWFCIPRRLFVLPARPSVSVPIGNFDLGHMFFLIWKLFIFVRMKTKVRVQMNDYCQRSCFLSYMCIRLYSKDTSIFFIYFVHRFQCRNTNVFKWMLHNKQPRKYSCIIKKKLCH